MPRGSSGRSASRPAPRAAPVRNPPQPAHQAPPPAPAQQSGGGIGSVVAEGMAFGTGSAMARRAVDAIMGPRTIQHEVVVSEASASALAAPSPNSDSCTSRSKAFQDCINHNASDISKCQFYLDMLNECRRGAGVSA